MCVAAFCASDEPFLLLKKFTPSCLFPEDRDDDVELLRGAKPRFAYPFTMALMGYATFRTTSLCVSIHARAFTQVAYSRRVPPVSLSLSKSVINERYSLCFFRIVNLDLMFNIKEIFVVQNERFSDT